MKKFIFLLLGTLFPMWLLAQQEVRFIASIEGEEISLYEKVKIKFTIEGTDYEDFRMPDFEGFQIVSGPYQSTQIQYINGEMSRHTSYSYQLQAVEAGKFTILPATIQVEEEILETEELEVEILKDGRYNPSKLEPESPFSQPAKEKKKNKIIYKI